MTKYVKLLPISSDINICHKYLNTNEKECYGPALWLCPRRVCCSSSPPCTSAPPWSGPCAPCALVLVMCAGNSVSGMCVIYTGARAKVWCLRIHGEASPSLSTFNRLLPGTLSLSPQVRSLCSLGLVWLAQLAYVLASAVGLSPGYQEVRRRID